MNSMCFPIPYGTILIAGVGYGSRVGTETSLKVGSGVGSETNHSGSTTLEEAVLALEKAWSEASKQNRSKQKIKLKNLP
jgi:hypothetical protein